MLNDILKATQLNAYGPRIRIQISDPLSPIFMLSHEMYQVHAIFYSLSSYFEFIL